jgi:hypothetical protein
MLTQRVASSLLGVLSMLDFQINAKDGRSTLPQPVTLEVVTKIFSQIDPNGKSISSDLMGRPVSWLGYMIEESSNCLNGIDQVWRYARFIDAELATLLDNIRLSQHAAMMTRFKSYQEALPSVRGGAMTFQNPDMSVWADPYYMCYQSALLLQQYCVRFRRLYAIV